MPVDDLWYLRTRDTAGQRLPSKRHGRGKRWRARWTDPETGEPRTELFEKKADAERHDANMHADISRGQYVDPRAGKITVAEYSERWRAQQLHRDSTAELLERAFRRHINPIIGRLQLSEVRASHLRRWVKNRVDALAPSSIHLVYSYISSMFAAAVIDKVIGSSPCVGVRLPEVPGEDRYIPTPEQVHSIARSIFDLYRPVPYLAAGCGLRAGEIFGLDLDNVDFLRREITVVQQLKRMTGQPAYLGELKTKTSRRVVELPEAVSGALARHIEKHPPRTIQIDDRTDPRVRFERPARLLFLTGEGTPLYSSSWSQVWRSAIQRAGLPEGFGLHGLRHYFATLLIHAGASVKTVQLALGHSTPMITLNTYAHEWPDALDRTRSLVDAALGSDPVAATGTSD